MPEAGTRKAAPCCCSGALAAAASAALLAPQWAGMPCTWLPAAGDPGWLLPSWNRRTCKVGKIMIACLSWHTKALAGRTPCLRRATTGRPCTRLAPQALLAWFRSVMGRPSTPRSGPLPPPYPPADLCSSRAASCALRRSSTRSRSRSCTTNGGRHAGSSEPAAPHVAGAPHARNPSASNSQLLTHAGLDAAAHLAAALLFCRHLCLQLSLVSRPLGLLCLPRCLLLQRRCTNGGQSASAACSCGAACCPNSSSSARLGQDPGGRLRGAAASPGRQAQAAAAGGRLLRGLQVVSKRCHSHNHAVVGWGSGCWPLDAGQRWRSGLKGWQAQRHWRGRLQQCLLLHWRRGYGRWLVHPATWCGVPCLLPYGVAVGWPASQRAARQCRSSWSRVGGQDHAMPAPLLIAVPPWPASSGRRRRRQAVVRRCCTPAAGHL